MRLACGADRLLCNSITIRIIGDDRKLSRLIYDIIPRQTEPFHHCPGILSSLSIAPDSERAVFPGCFSSDDPGSASLAHPVDEEFCLGI